MTTSNSRDIELRIAAKATGSDQIVNLTNELLDMAKSAGDAAPEFEALAAQLTRLGQQNTAARTFEEISLDADKTASAMFTAAQRVQALGAEFAEQTAIVDKYKSTQAEAREAVKTTSVALEAAKTNLNRFKEDATAADRATVGYKEQLAKLRGEVRALEDQLTQQKGLVDSKTQYNSIVGALEKLAAGYLKAQADVSKLDRALADQTSKLDAAKQALIELGIEAIDFAQAQRLLTSAREQTTASIEREVAALRQSKTISEAVAAGNEKAVAQARAAAAARATAAAEAAAVEQRALRETEAALLRQKLAQEEVAASAKRATQALSGAFSATGVRSAREIQNEIVQINNALGILASSSTVSWREFDRAFTSAKERTAALERELKGLPPVLASTLSASDLLKQSLSQLTAAFGAFQIGSGFIAAVNQIEALRRAMTIITGDTQAAAGQIQFLRDTANRAGLSVGALTQDFINFSAAATTSGISLERQREVFGAVATAAGQLGISTDRVGLILQALAQTANKGKVSLEELQGQLGESLPGALAIVSNGFGVTKERLLEMVKAGIDGQAFFDAFARGVSTSFTNAEGKVVSLAASWNRLKNAFTETAQQAADTAVYRALVSVIDSVAGSMKTVVDTTINLGQAFAIVKIVEVTRGFLGLEAASARAALAAKEHAAATVQDTAATVENTRATQVSAVAKGELAVATTAAAKATTAAAAASAQATTAVSASVVATTAAVTAWGKMGAAVSGALGALRGFLAILGGPVGATITVAIAFYDQLEGAFVKLYGRITGTTDALEANEKKLAEIAAKEKARADEFNRQQALRAESFRQVGELMDAEVKKLQARQESLDGTAAVVQRDIDLRIAQAKLAGDGIALADLELQKAVELQKAAESNAKSTSNELAMLQRKREALIVAVGGYNNLNEAQRTQVRELDELIRKAREELPLAEQRARLAAVEAANRKLAATEAAGQVSSLVELKRAHEESQAALERATRLEREGLVVGQNLTKMRIDAAAAEGAYNARLEATLKTVGLTKEELRGGMSPALKQAADNTEDLALALADAKVKAEEAGPLLARSLDKQVEAAGTEKALRGVIARIEEMILKRPELEKALTEPLVKAKQKADELVPGINSVAEAYRQLGLKAPEELKRIAEANRQAFDKIKNDASASLATKQEAFKRYADSAIAANGGIVSSTLEAQAKALGLAIEFDKTGKAIVKAMDGAKTAVKELAAETNVAGEQLNRLAGSLSSVYDAETKARSEKVKANRLPGATYDKQGFAVDSGGQRITGGAYLPPPDNSGEWEWVPALNQGYTYGGYWQRTVRGGSGQLSSVMRYTGMTGSEGGFGNPFNLSYYGAGTMFDRGYVTPTPPDIRAVKGIEDSSLRSDRPASNKEGLSGDTLVTDAQNVVRPGSNSSSAAYRVDIVINGAATSINAASQADAAALAELLRQLGQAANRSGT